MLVICATVIKKTLYTAIICDYVFKYVTMCLSGT